MPATVAGRNPLPLSKTGVLSGHRCVRKLWLELNEKDASELADLQKSRPIIWGKRVGEKARTYFPGGLLIEGDTGERIEKTRKALADGARTLFEASFDHQGVYASADILRKMRSSYVLIEVKSSTKVEDHHLLDAAIQTWVLRGAGIDVQRAELMVLNKECRFPDLSNLFVQEDLTEKVDALVSTVPEIVRQVRAGVGTKSLPDVDTGPQCNKPYPCPFIERCSAGLPAHHVSELYKISQKNLTTLGALGIETIHELPKDFDLPVIADRQRRSVRSRRLIVEDGLDKVLATFKPPLGFLDFETVALPIPCWDGCRPYEQVPVQFSFDLQTPTGLRHSEWIADGSRDPRPAIAAALVEACEGAKTILAYYASFEKGRIEGLMRAIPALSKKLGAIRDRIEDLLPVVREHVYHPEFHGSFSIKDVHPALTGTDPYGKLEVGDGDAAMTALEQLMFESLPPVDREALRRSLLNYCATDTRVMVELHAALTNA